ncbi:volume-regulated anion channel subunit LRRC8D-like [Spea bombifrons]|uniref:volume-regulated anion channel subunit LRRC8D-like n=1 Tax=Spea bombifrons TaxID=233779 RepID=UPI00234BBE16|nr:volume-regulated anion channel subunit LRRC8D-like [Spea bombifrons]
MITVTEAASLGASQAHFKALKPWWDVLMDSLLVIMLMVSFFSATLLITTDKVVCMPKSTTPNINKSGGMDDVLISPTTPKQPGHLTNLDYQQYMYVSVVCYHKVVPWQSKYFPYLTLINSLLLLVSSNFWFKYPKTSSKVDHFLSILAKCFESPWTTKALAETGDQPPPEPVRLKSSCSRSVEYSTRTPLIKEFPFSPIQQPVSTILDKKEEQQAKALFERIRHFRAHAEDSDVVYRVYVGQTVTKVVKVTIVLGYAFSLVGSFSFQHICKPGIQNLMGYSEFTCTHNLAYILEKLLLTYILLVCLYAFLSVFALIWLFTHPLKVYSFEKNNEGNVFGDISDVKNDFAFMLHMVDRYDTLYSKRFSVFLSAVSEGRLRELAVNSEWTQEKLKEQMKKDSKGRCELHLSMIPSIPVALYDLSEIEVLKLELITSAKILGTVSNLRSLSEIHLLHCPAKVDTDAYRFLQECLKVLHVWFTDLEELPNWVYSMKNLQELHLSGNLNPSNNKSIRLQTLRGLTDLRVLSLTSNLSYLPPQIWNLAGQLHQLRIHNGGTVLCSLGQLKKMSHLTDLELQHCQIMKIPAALPSLTNLQSLDLTSNLLQSVEELGNQHRLRSLRTLRLCHNDINSLHPSIENLYNLEEFSVSHNKLETLPATVFNLVKLRHFDISNNRIRVIPPQVGYLSRLELLAVTDNHISSLPVELFRCTRLRSLKVGRNKLSSIPPEVKQLTLLSNLELSGNNLTTLPVEIACCSMLKKRGLDVEESVLDTLPLELRSKFL